MADRAGGHRPKTRAKPRAELTAGRLEGEWASLVAERAQLERMQTDLLSTVSHELRTPLTLIRTSIGLLLDSDPDLEMRQRLLQNIRQSADRMHALVTDLLDLARLRSGRAEMSVRYVDVAEVTRDVAGLVKPLVDAKRQTLVLDLPSDPPVVMADRRRLEQVLLNLLSNANKFAQEGGRVRVAVVEGGDEMVVSVSDDGPGVSPEVQTHLFEQFYTARTSSASHNIGAGLGLPIAKGIVEAHGGRIWVESEPNVETKFYFSLPKEGPASGGPS